MQTLDEVSRETYVAYGDEDPLSLLSPAVCSRQEAPAAKSSSCGKSGLQGDWIDGWHAVYIQSVAINHQLLTP